MVHLLAIGFDSRIQMDNPGLTIQSVKKVYQRGILWSDGLKFVYNQRRAAVAWDKVYENDWSIMMITLGKNQESIDAKLWEIWEALYIALWELISQNRIIHVTIFSDLQKPLYKLCKKSSHDGKIFNAQVYHTASKFNCKRYKVTWRLIPSYKKIERNDSSEKATKQVAIPRRVKTWGWSSWSYIFIKRRETSREKLNIWHSKWEIKSK